MPLRKDYDGQNCGLARALEVVGERWTLLVVRDLFFGVRRFGELQAHLDIPRAVLADRLETLVAHGLVAHRGREYELTQAGADLWPAVYSLIQFGDRHFRGPRRVFLHATCGATLTASGACPECGVQPQPHDIETRPGPGPGTRSDPVSVALRRPHRLLTRLARS